MALTLNSHVLNLGISGIRTFSNQLANFPDAINLTIGQPDFPTPQHIKEAAISSILADYTGYSHNAGLLSLRQEVQSFFFDRYNLSYRAEDEIYITVGASEALDIAFRTILEEGDEVILFAPVYPGYIPVIELCGAVPILIDTSGTDFKPTLDQIKKAVTPKTKAILFNYPSNPTGVILTRDEIRTLTDWIRTQELFVVSDEIYSENTFGSKHVSFASMEGMRERTIIIHGLSKSHSMTGWRIGFTMAPAFLIEQMIKVHLYSVTCAPVTSQYAAIQALRYGRDDSDAMNKEYVKRLDFLYNRLREMGLETMKPSGAFYIFPKIPSIFPDSYTFATQLLTEGGVAVVPGSAFSSFGEGYFRISYAYSMDILKEGLDRLEKFLQNHCIKGV
ncbi:aminotransferase class I/II-fold pyridoxal phosphate-dependent enzyme [Bacillus sp. DTU_2020_1000418_1_SI_GHA_SEK_038]|uniref:aminotransferase class I/II-fold pyridoxal phosphate-dependent enzyme n=1 Tax=Bacillus sp. DTU_2020_1000418_1_SI_GHA_SEK_038 TaxID=3077585 RepID=UPI0028E5B588|nr:aminotransferase class I/II-fold pyridoxal phosphate-dependent enzyme [Bacillus sp. DTU_2020_1000418_1_SI_GHA_SEK_038]WNS76608.1 aminotransferase class I/II-fold pyridoxal phosphate-dependent enzyme [Bacillus sp. DTU_2020_1000418_1_SI_GHA_SEK_038]